jgi:hypothetical protein
MIGAMHRILRARLWNCQSLGQHLARLMPALLVFAAGTLATAQDVNKAYSSDTPIKVEVGLVNLNITVTDRTGQPYTALKADNFRVYDNGIE